VGVKKIKTEKKIMKKDLANSDSDETPKQKKKTSGYLMHNASRASCGQGGNGEGNQNCQQANRHSSSIIQVFLK
jgi:hypothetical protein